MRMNENRNRKRLIKIAVKYLDSTNDIFWHYNFDDIPGASTSTCPDYVNFLLINIDMSV